MDPFRFQIRQKGGVDSTLRTRRQQQRIATAAARQLPQQQAQQQRQRQQQEREARETELVHIMRAGKEKGFQDGIEAGREMERAQKEERAREKLMWNAARHRVVFYVILWLL
ncbi:hypothetical protein ABVK25_003262 [Lepraria finkii]|uniref:Uncharacterized protein n=1 Tax=Lepraria finkii TaxID=1340010 RepID=A0ABR4BHG2_9LECA